MAYTLPKRNGCINILWYANAYVWKYMCRRMICISFLLHIYIQHNTKNAHKFELMLSEICINIFTLPKGCLYKINFLAGYQFQPIRRVDVFSHFTFTSHCLSHNMDWWMCIINRIKMRYHTNYILRRCHQHFISNIGLWLHFDYTSCFR